LCLISPPSTIYRARKFVGRHRIGVAAVAITGWLRLDPIIALLVAANIVWTAIGLLRRSAAGPTFSSSRTLREQVAQGRKRKPRLRETDGVLEFETGQSPRF
jgi:Co/Zn/Cd efflux system component